MTITREAITAAPLDERGDVTTIELLVDGGKLRRDRLQRGGGGLSRAVGVLGILGRSRFAAPHLFERLLGGGGLTASVVQHTAGVACIGVGAGQDALSGAPSGFSAGAVGFDRPPVPRRLRVLLCFGGALFAAVDRRRRRCRTGCRGRLTLAGRDLDAVSGHEPGQCRKPRRRDVGGQPPRSRRPGCRSPGGERVCRSGDALTHGWPARRPCRLERGQGALDQPIDHLLTRQRCRPCIACPARKRGLLSVTEPVAGGHERVEVSAMVPVRLVDRPCRDAWLGERPHPRRVLSAAGFLQTRSQRGSRLDEGVEAVAVQRVELTLEIDEFDGRHAGVGAQLTAARRRVRRRAQTQSG